MVLVFMPIVLLTLVGQLWPMSKTMKSEMNSYAAAGAVAEEVHKLEKRSFILKFVEIGIIRDPHSICIQRSAVSFFTVVLFMQKVLNFRFELTRYDHFLDKGRKSGIRKAFITALSSGLYQFVFYALMGGNIHFHLLDIYNNKIIFY